MCARSEFKVSAKTIPRRYKTYLDSRRLGRKSYKRKRLISDETVQRLEQGVEANPFRTHIDIDRDLGLNIPKQSISRYCKQLNLPSRISPKKIRVLYRKRPVEFAPELDKF